MRSGASSTAPTAIHLALFTSSVRLLGSSGWLVRLCISTWLGSVALIGWASAALESSAGAYGSARSTLYLLCAACATPALLCALLVGALLVLPRAGPVPLLYWHAFAGLVACGTLPLAPFSPVALGAHFALLGSTASTLPAYCQVLADRYPAELSQAHGVVLLMVPLAAAVVPPLASHLPDGRARGVEAAKALAVLAAIGGVACALLAGCAWEERRRRATQHHPYTGAGSRFDLLSGDLSVLTEGAGPAPGPAPGGTRFDLLSGDTALRTGGPFSPVKV